LVPLQGRRVLLQHPDRRGAGDERGVTYETPFPAMAAIKDYVAFYPERVDKIR
jgi:hypothetical protein